ncbi:MAG: hypothetical protein ACI4TE_08475 [Alphaproteobacteria bacterium]
MRNLSGRFCIAFSLFLGGLLPSSVFAATAASRQFSSERPASEKPAPPPEASSMSQEDLKAVSPITFDELRLFARDWLKYARWLKTDGNQYKAVAYLGVSAAADYPSEVVKWMDAHGWAVDRFFLLERKFRITLSVLEQESKQSNLLRHLESQIRQLEKNDKMSADQKKSLKEQYAGTIRTVRAATSVKAPVTPDEYELIKLNREALTRILGE